MVLDSVLTSDESNVRPPHSHPHRKILLPEMSDTDRDLDSSTIVYSSLLPTFCNLAPHNPPFDLLNAKISLSF